MNTNPHPDQERCKKLTEIGFPETENTMEGTGEIIGTHEIPENTDANYYVLKGRSFYHCPSVMEMLDVIPAEIPNDSWFHIHKMADKKNEYVAGYMYWDEKLDDKWMIPFWQDTLPNALADLIFWLHDNNYIKF